MSSNPYLDRTPTMPVVENEQVQTTEILDAVTGARHVIGATNTSVTIDANGGRHFAQQQIRIRGTDGRPINPTEPVYPCKCGCKTDLLSSSSVRFCEFCQLPILKTHAMTWDDGTTRAAVCPACWQPGHTKRAIKRFLTWLLKI